MDMGSGPALQYLLCLAWVAATLPIAAAALPIPTAAGGRFIHGLLCAFSSRGKTVRPSVSSSSKTVRLVLACNKLLLLGPVFSY